LFLGTYALLVRLFGGLPGFTGGAAIDTVSGIALLEEGFGKGDILYGLFSGGTIVAAFLLILEPSSGTKTRIGAAAAAFAGGVFTFFFRYRGNELYGAFFAIALLNILTPVIRSIEDRVFHNPGSGGTGRPA
ncbi:MAG: RnfABCDGE type electron transport complex subunit D, partial [Spirochaetaceae bacterium]|nr:RnfABCDGE type electron transport complex subunit D [Spirochaetaceae bacterium]